MGPLRDTTSVRNNLTQILQLKEFLRRHRLPVSGKKEVLINRLVQAARDIGRLPALPPTPPSQRSPPPSPCPTSPSDSDFSFSLPGMGTPATGADDRKGGADDGGRIGAGMSDAPGETAGGDRVGSGGEGSRAPAVMAAAGQQHQQQQEASLRERVRARVRERDLVSAASDKVGPTGATHKSGSGGAGSSGSGSRQSKSRPPTAGVDGRPSMSTQAKSSVNGRPSSSQQRAIEAGKEAVAEATAKMGPPARRPLGSLGSGNVRTSVNAGKPGGMQSAGKMGQAATAARTAVTKQPSGSGVVVAGGTAKQRNQGDATRSAFPAGARGGEKARAPVAAGHRLTPAVQKGSAGSHRPGSSERGGSSSGVTGDVSRRKEARTTSGSFKRPAPGGSIAGTSASAATTLSNKRVRADGGGDGGVKTASTKASFSSKPAKPSGGGAPSFMKPTKTSGARIVPGSDLLAAPQKAQPGREQ